MKLKVLIGNIASGKTSYREGIPEHYLISRDRWRYNIGLGSYVWNPDLEPGITRCCKAELKLAIEAGLDIIVDETNMSRASRKWVLDMVPDTYTKEAIVFPNMGENEHVKRRLGCNHGNTSEETWRRVYRRKNKSYQAPTTAEGFDEITFL